MAKIAYRTVRFRSESLERIERVNEILSKYDQKLTARQVYYQFVARGWLANNEKNYKAITNLLTDARYAGLVDWDAIEDRGREPQTPSQWNDIESLVDSALYAYRLPRWDGQKYYVELWVEKQALAGVLWPLAQEFHVVLMVNKGYSSSSAMKESADRFRRACDMEECEDEEDFIFSSRPKPLQLYLGDHDPSGEDMVRDIHDRLAEFRVFGIEVRKLALTMRQIEEFNPPPNPAKMTDSRARGYVEKYGSSSWELDALPPDELTRIVRRAFESVIDKSKMDAVKQRELQDKDLLKKAAAELRKTR